MKVLYITNISTPYNVEMFNELGKYCDLTVLYERNYAKDRNKSWLESNKQITFKSIVLKGSPFRKDSAFNPTIIKWLRKDYDIYVSSYSSPTGMLTFEYLRMKKKILIFKADGGIIKNDNKLKYALKRHFISSASYYLSSGKTTSEYLIHYGANAKNIMLYPFSSLRENEILNNVISQDEKLERKKQLNVRERIMVLTVGQFIHRKGFDILLRACSKLNADIGVYFVGGDLTKEYKKIVTDLNLTNVHFEGFKTKEEIVNYYKASDIFVLPTREDIWGLVINEALAFGVPTITTDKCVAGLELIADGENGFIVPVENYELLANRINLIEENEILREEMASKSLQVVKSYTIENIANKHLELFHKIVAKSSKKNA